MVHSSLVEAIVGHCGLIAGCGFAVFFLKAYFLDLDGAVLYCTIRIYVDDITMTAKGHSPSAVVRKLSRDMPKAKRALEQKDQRSNERKEQLYSPNVQVLKLWKACHPSYSGDITHQAKDLGICQRALHKQIGYPYHTTRPGRTHMH